jgi:hypothetical protein
MRQIGIFGGTFSGLLFLISLVTSAQAQSLPPELQTFYAALTSSDAQERYSSRDAITAAIGQIPEPRRSDLIAELIEGFPRQNYRIQLALALALSKQALPWTARDLQAHVMSLYQQFVTQPDDTLKSSIDDALANAKGYYRDAILDYINDRIDNLDSTVAKFKRTATDFPASKYVPPSILYLAQYLTRAYLLGHPRGRTLIDDSNSVLRSMPEGNLSDDAAFHLALNDLLIGDRAGGISMLQAIEAKYSDRDRIYVHQFFFSKKPSMVVDKTFPTKDLARKLREYVQRNGAISPDDQTDLIRSVTGGS